MILNRRRLFVSMSVAALTSPHANALAQSDVTSGGIGLTLADIQSMYPELPPGQSFASFTDEVTGATMYIDFGQDDIARNFWISGEMDVAATEELIAWLCPDDALATHIFEQLSTAGSVAMRTTQVYTSDFLGQLTDGRTAILASYIAEPGQPEVVRDLHLTVEQLLG